MKKKDFEFLAHTADLKIRVFGANKQELFRHAVIGMFQSIGPHAAGCNTVDERLICPQLPEERSVVVESMDINALIVDFLSEALYLSDVHNEAYLDAEITELTDTKIEAVLHGIKVERFDVVEIKAVTYYGVDIKKVGDLWQTDIVFDI